MGVFARRRYELAALAIGLVTVAVHACTAEPRVSGDPRPVWLVERAVQSIEHRVHGLFFRVRGARPAHPDVVVVAIDEKSVQTWGLWPWPRQHMAEAFDRLAEAGVAAVGMDATFTDARLDEVAEASDTLGRLERLPSTPELEAWKTELRERLARSGDDALEASLRRLGPKLVQGVITIDAVSAKDFEQPALAHFNALMAPHVVRSIQSGQGVTRELKIEKANLWTFVGLQAPLARFVDTGNRFGHFTAILDLDGTIRRSASFVRLDALAGLFPSVALQTAAVALGGELRPVIDADGAVIAADIVGAQARRVPIDGLAPFTVIDYPGSATAFTTYSIADVVSGAIGPSELKGKTVLIGVTVVGSSGDQRVTPFKELEPGIYQHAAMVSNVLADRFLTRPGWAPFLEMALVLVLAVLLGVAVPRVRFFWKGVLIAGVVSAWVIGAFLAFRGGVLLGVAAPVTGLLSISFVLVFLGYVSVDREKLKLRSTFSRYLDEEVMALALENPERLNKGEKREMTVLFSDIRGFTTLSERMSPEVLARFINAYLSPMTAIVFDEQGTLDKYIGDALMAFWNAPLDQPDHAVRACRAALKMLEKLDAMKAAWRAEGYPELEIGIGINTGTMVVGNMGSDVRVDYTVLGDAVNLGSRLESTNKEYDTRVIISESTYQLVKGEMCCRRLSSVRVKGKRLPVNIYELRGVGPPPPADAPIIARFEEAHALYVRQRFAEASQAFKEVLDAWPTDLATRRYLAQIDVYLVTPPPSDWDGVASITTK